MQVPSRYLCIAMAGLIPALFASYVFLNWGKVETLHEHYISIFSGKPAKHLTLVVNEQTSLDITLPSGNLFDASGLLQLEFVGIDQQTSRQLEDFDASITARLNGVPLSVRLLQDHGHKYLNLPGYKLYLIADKDVASIARVVRGERANRGDIVRCTGTALCTVLKLDLADGWGALEGPYLPAYISNSDDAMPRGRWVIGSNAQFTVTSLEARKITFHLSMLSTVQEQTVRIGSLVLRMSRQQQKSRSRDYTGIALYPMSVTVGLDLAAGESTIPVYFSKGIYHEGSKLPITAYVTSVEVSEQDNETSNTR